MIDNALVEISVLTTPASQAYYGPVMDSRSPRHIVQKSREVYSKLQQFKQLNGLPPNQIPHFPTEHISQLHIQYMVDMIYFEAKQLRMGLRKNSPMQNAPKPKGKTHAELYYRLEKMNYLLTPLLPEADVSSYYPKLISLISDLDAIRQARRIYTPVGISTGSKKKGNYDVYYQLIKVFGQLQRFCTINMELCPRDGLAIFPMVAKDIDSRDISDAIYAIMAEVGAIKIRLGLKNPTRDFPPKYVNTVDQVYDAAVTAQQLAATIR